VVILASFAGMLIVIMFKQNGSKVLFEQH